MAFRKIEYCMQQCRKAYSKASILLHSFESFIMEQTQDTCLQKNCGTPKKMDKKNIIYIIRFALYTKAIFLEQTNNMYTLIHGQKWSCPIYPTCV